MTTLLIALSAFFGFIIAYHTYGRWLARRIFGLDPRALVPSHELRDDLDFVPTKRQVIFGHHFTSIAGTGPIVGPAIAVFWGWLPALLWVVLGSIFIGAVHDFGSLVVSLRNQGQTVGEIAGRVIAPRTKYLFLLILFFALTVVLAVFGLVIANIFSYYPESVLSVWITLPIAVVIGFWVYRRGGGLLWPSIAALIIMYGAIYVGAYYLPIDLNSIFQKDSKLLTPVMAWTAILFVYCFFASVLPVWVLLQPRDYVNSHQLVLALGLLVLGLLVAAATGQTNLIASAPAVATDIPADAPPIWPFLFITIACGAVSGFHCLVSSGTSSKQINNETDAQYVGYGAMLLEGALAVIVILACCAGVGMGNLQRDSAGKIGGESTRVTGLEAWKQYYPSRQPLMENGVQVVDAGGQPMWTGGWNNHSLKMMVGAFIDGGANFMTTLGIAPRFGVAIIAVLVASFAATTLDTATRLQRYVIQELAQGIGIAPLTNKYAATLFAVVLAGAMACIPATPGGAWGTGGLILWPLFGATNQLLAGLSFMVIVFYLWRRNKPILFATIPMLLMLLMPAAALLWNMFNPDSGWWFQGKYLLFSIGLIAIGLQLWMMIEGAMMWQRAKGVQEAPPVRSRELGRGGDGERMKMHQLLKDDVPNAQ